MITNKVPVPIIADAYAVDALSKPVVALTNEFNTSDKRDTLLDKIAKSLDKNIPA